MIEILLSFSLASIALAFSPGPDNIFVFTQSVTNGSSYGIATTAGLISGCILHTTLVAFGISAIIMASEGVFLGIKIAGACYLLYLAYQVYKAGNTLMITSEEAVKKSHMQLYKQGVIMNILNPKVSLFFLAFFPAFLWDKEGNTIVQFYILGLLFMGISFVVFSSIALLSGRISTFLQQKKNSGVFFKWLQIIVFIGIAIFLFLP
ncbi:MAG: lysine transporter LysE [Flavobacteriaceae bacterium CG_4_8_14_3_um_filter_34_10]|nr:LysE family translocator [Flavobacteriia bacterium]OIP52726.1 MAG: lysine transporter LysE [Flavobacteriaceae bacterium CG2_30_34_30]PIQ19566.1 MAG: lysine transporter LysE [Flavobacteriaceae bacterium CG18_big_fil_WC_8_21_14_2_50_34_36]PIV48567.1 MAG: lysine transporter LysE [Flavobacteriaceae bacterium CG02_land_8_20_14_3_00_34_13]PIX09298.1 MAG: lysine transporter LysE [Flavobacteriaceae bacterium CG_4_8_14_3_um_filter_34_10]PIZ07371.1 MAG: lysine transporter LysE [Flavobacteriaceae bact